MSSRLDSSKLRIVRIIRINGTMAPAEVYYDDAGLWKIEAGQLMLWTLSWTYATGTEPE